MQGGEGTSFVFPAQITNQSNSNFNLAESVQVSTMLVATPTKMQLGRPLVDSGEESPILSRKRTRLTCVDLTTDDSEDEFDLESTQKIKKRAVLSPDTVGDGEPRPSKTSTTPVGTWYAVAGMPEC